MANKEEYTYNKTTITIDLDRDKKLTVFAKATLKERYLWEGETSPQHMFARVAVANSNDNEHAQRIYDYISNLWFMPATPVLSNSGHDTALPISCFLNEVGDNLEEIEQTLSENFWLAARGGGIGTNWTPVREQGAKAGPKGKTSGIIPFLKMQDSATLGVSQGGLRRGSSAAYLDVRHPEIAEFLRIRRPEGDVNRQCLNIHHGVVIPDEFMEAVKAGLDWNLTSRLTGAVVETVQARDLFRQIVTSRLETGEPYMWFVDNVNKLRPEVYVRNNLYNTTSNLCSEITLSTSVDYNGKRRTAVCCLSSLNLEYFLEWENDALFIRDVMYFLDNVMQNFIDKTEGVKGFERARYAAIQERSVGLGVMGFHSFLQAKAIALEGVMSKVWNKKIFQHIKQKADEASIFIGTERGPCPDAARVGLMDRFAHKLATAPTASISIICGESSPGIEPLNANCYVQKTLSGSFFVRNKYLNGLLQIKFIQLKLADIFDEDFDAKQKAWVDQQWAIIIENEHGKGSVQGLEYLTEEEKAIFKTAFEIDQNWLVELAADRTPFICQGQSLNLFIPANVNKADLVKIHMKGWQLGIKGFYYVRSKSVRQASNIAGEMPQPREAVKVTTVVEEVHEGNEDYIIDEGCLACQ